MGLFLFGLSGGEIIVIFLVILVLFGADKIPDLARSFGRGMNEFKKATDEIKREIQSSANDLKDDFNEARRAVTQDADELKKDLKEPLDFDPYDMSDEGNDYKPDEPQIQSTKKRGRKPKISKKENPTNNESDESENRYKKS